MVNGVGLARAIASFIIPGLGQAAGGRIRRGIYFFAGVMVLSALSAIAGFIPVIGEITSLIFAAAAFIGAIWSAVDAY